MVRPLRTGLILCVIGIAGLLLTQAATLWLVGRAPALPPSAPGAAAVFGRGIRGTGASL